MKNSIYESIKTLVLRNTFNKRKSKHEHNMAEHLKSNLRAQKLESYSMDGQQ
jgi:threonine aldolase